MFTNTYVEPALVAFECEGDTRWIALKHVVEIRVPHHTQGCTMFLSDGRSVRVNMSFEDVIKSFGLGRK